MKIVASRKLKWLYCLTLASLILPNFIGASAWVGMTMGRDSSMLGVGIFLLILMAAYVWRIAIVALRSGTLDAYVSGNALKYLRLLGIFLMAVGLMGSFAILVVKPLTFALFGRPGDAEIDSRGVSLGLYFIGSTGMLGLGIFEMSRLFGFESMLRGGPDEKGMKNHEK